METDREVPKSSSAIARQKTLSIMLTYRCTAQCKNCGTFSSPKDKSRNEIDVVLSIVEQAKVLGFSNVVFTGGEATIEWAALVRAIEFSSSLRLPSRLVTNAHWATDPVITKQKLNILIEAGLSEINYSTGHEHLRFIPIDNIVNAVVESLKSRLVTVLMFEVRSPPTVSLQDITDRILARCGPDLYGRYFKTVESPWMPVQPFRKSATPNETLVNVENIVSRTGCDSVLQTYVLQGDGRISSCCGLGMRTIRELQASDGSSDHCLKDAIERSESDWFKVALRYIGPEKLLAWAASKDGSIEWENMYAHRCHACIRIYRDKAVKQVVRNHFTELIGDLVCSAYIDEVMAPLVGEQMPANKSLKRTIAGDPAISA